MLKTCILRLLSFISIGYGIIYSTGHSTEVDPWLSPLWEFQWRTSLLYDHVSIVQTPKGSFKDVSNDYSTQFSLGVTPWPCWNIEAELYLTRTSDIDFSYEALYLTARYLWLDDLSGDLISLTTGLTCSLPGNPFLRDFSFPYHGHLNLEGHVAIGKEWSREKKEWSARLWAYGGVGITNRGTPWLSGTATWDLNLSDRLECGAFTFLLYGLGHNNIIPNIPFTGFALINHQNVDIGLYLNYDYGYLGTLTLIGWYNVHAHNFVENTVGIGASLLIPFSLF